MRIKIFVVVLTLLTATAVVGKSYLSRERIAKSQANDLVWDVESVQKIKRLSTTGSSIAVNDLVAKNNQLYSKRALIESVALAKRGYEPFAATSTIIGSEIVTEVFYRKKIPLNELVNKAETASKETEKGDAPVEDTKKVQLEKELKAALDANSTLYDQHKQEQQYLDGVIGDKSYDGGVRILATAPGSRLEPMGIITSIAPVGTDVFKGVKTWDDVLKLTNELRGANDKVQVRWRQHTGTNYTMLVTIR